MEIDDPQRMSATERRRAAVLVTVVSDYPALVDRMAPADAQRAIARVREVAVDVAREYGGLVNQAIGDEIVSLFGVPSAHEDDELRAVRAALDLHARVRSDRSTASFRPRFACACSRVCTSDLSSRVVCTKGRAATTSSARRWRKPLASRSWRTPATSGSARRRSVSSARTCTRRRAPPSCSIRRRSW